MSESPLAAIVGRLVRRLPPTDGTADEALLARFVGWRDEAAFELLVYRHGPMVRGLCRRMLRHEQDAEDAFQATFLALAKKASVVRGQSLAGWLYRVAFHAALKAKGRRAPRQPLVVGMGGTKDVPAPSGGHGTPEEAAHHGELAAALDEEILRLPERFRLPVVLCYLQGRSNSEAATALGIPKGTVDSRLSTARHRLRVRLIRRGFAPAIAGAALERSLDAAAVPGSVARAVTKAAVLFISKQAGVPATAAILAEGALHTMNMTRLTWAMASVATLAFLGSGAGVVTYGALAADGPPAKVADDTKEPPPKVAPASATPALAHAKKQDGTSAIESASDLRKLLQQSVQFDRPIMGSPLKDVLEFLSDKYGITIRMDIAAFKRLGIEKPGLIYDQQVDLPVAKNMTLGQILHDLLAQVVGDPNAKSPGYYPAVTFQVKGLHVVIVPEYLIPMNRTTTTEADVAPLINPDIIEYQVQGDPVSIEFKEKPLVDCLRELSDATGANVVLDSRQNESGQIPVTVTLQNVRLLTALRVLADMVDLQPVAIGNVYYVTTKENADRLHRQEWLRPAPGSQNSKPVAPGKPVSK